MKGVSCFYSITNFDAIKLTFVHEILHLLNAAHHSDDIKECVFGDNRHWANVEIALPMCSQCLSRVNALKLKLYNHNS